MNRPLNSYFRKRWLHDRNQALEKATAVTTVSPWHVQTLKTYNPNTYLIYNGYDPELFYPETISTTQFTITYTGRLLSLALRDPSLLLAAIQHLDQAQTIQPKTFQVVWYTDTASQALIKQEAERLHVSDYMDYRGYVPASEIPRILNQSSILLLLTNKAGQDKLQGIMTTKFFESLAVEKPILCVRSDEGCLEAALQETQAGLAGRDVATVCQFLLEKWEEWKTKGFTTSNTRKERLDRYSRKGQAAQFVELFDKVCHP